MADFRKCLFAFAVLALMLGASTAYAQIPGGGTSSIVCDFSPANPTTVSAENISALVGDFVLICTGGTPTPAGQLIPQDNVTLTLNVNVTSRLLGGGYIDALLTIDEPFPTAALGGVPNPQVNGPSQIVGSPTGQRVCFSNTTGGNASFPPGCNNISGTFNPVTFSFPNKSPYDPSGANGANAYNIFVAHTGINAGQVTWLGVPIDGPGTFGSRIIRMTNIRANACSTTVSNGLVPTAITGVLSFNGSQNVVINQTGAQTLASVQQGLVSSSTNAFAVQCNNLNVGAGGTGGNFPGGKAGIPTFAVTLTEGYAAAFKRKTAAFLPNTISDVNDSNNTTYMFPQNVPGFNYNSESGFEPPATNGVQFGFATQGDRFLLVFNNVNAGVSLWVPQYVALVLASSSTVGGTPVPGNSGPVAATGTGNPAWQGGWLQLVASNSDLSGNITSVAPTSTATFEFVAPPATTNPFFATNPFLGPGLAGVFANAVQLSGTGSTLTAVYEVVNADPAAIEKASIPIGVAFVANTPNNLPAPGQSTVTASFAPLSTVQTATATDPIPRWCNKSTAANSFKIGVCTCDLLFPFVTNASGFDTGIAIANTSLDIYGTAPQNGTITLNFFGSLPGTPAPAPITAQTSSIINAGTELVFTLSGGNGGQNIQAEVGFQGYVIAVAQFQWCHGFAFISDLGAQRLAEGYLAIQLDLYGGSGLNRTGIVGEVQGH
jgi:hypothetical protein